MYGIDTNDRAAMADLAKTAFDMTQKQAEMLETLRHNRHVEKKDMDDADYQRFMDNKQFELKALEAQMKDGGGNKFTEIKRAYYEDLQTKYGMSSQEAAIETNRVFGQNGADGNPFASPSELESAKGNAMFAVITANPTISYEDPRFMPLVEQEMARVMALSRKRVNFPAGDDINFGGNQ